mgnify:CR=1 FL=1
MSKAVISIIMPVYGVEEYVGKAIESIQGQTFQNWELWAVDDGSPDRSGLICDEYAEKYPELIKLITSEKNVGAIANERRAMKAAKGKYIAFCEGDDYWTAPLKLQKQVDFLEKNPEYSVCFHRCKHFNVVDGTTKDDQCGFLFQNSEEGVDVTVEMFFDKWITQPLTMVYRSSMFDLDDMLKYKYYCDTYQIFHLLLNAKGYLFGFDGGIRIRQDAGVYSTLDELKRAKRAELLSRELYVINQHSNIRELFLYYERNLKYMISLLKFPYKIPYIIKFFFLTKNIKLTLKYLIK